MFVTDWLKEVEITDGRSRKVWRHKKYQNYVQTVKPYKETHLIEAAIEGNLAFLETYVKFKGDLTIQDQQGKSALTHAILNNRKHFAKMICQFSTLFQSDPATFVNLLELSDNSGNTPLFTAIKVNSVKALKLLISYKVNFFHRKKNGNTCLHECAVHNSVDCLIVLTPYCGDDLFSVINKEGNRAIDIAFHKKATDVFHALQKMERNSIYQNAVFEREHTDPWNSKPQFVKSDDSSFERIKHLPPRHIDDRSSRWNYYDEKSFRQHLKKKKPKKTTNDVPSFKNYRDEIMNSQASGIRSRSRQPEQTDSHYYSQMRAQRAHHDNYFGEASYFKQSDFPNRSRHTDSKPNLHSSIRQQDRSYFEIDLNRQSSRIELEEQPSHAGQMFHSRFIAENNMTVDDIEK